MIDLRHLQAHQIAWSLSAGGCFWTCSVINIPNISNVSSWKSWIIRCLLSGEGIPPLISVVPVLSCRTFWISLSSWKISANKWHTSPKESLKIALTIDDFNLSGCFGVSVNRTCSGNEDKPYLTDDEDPEPTIRLAGIRRWLQLRMLPWIIFCGWYENLANSGVREMTLDWW